MIRASGGGVRACLAAVCLLVLAPAAHAQLRVTGTATSDTSAPVAGAEVTVRQRQSDQVVARAVSDAAGLFTLEIPAADDYRVSVERQGFYAITHLEIWLPPLDPLVLTLFPVREHLESLDVTSRGDPISVTQSSSEKTLSGAEAMNVPFAGSHSVRNALKTLPGVVQDGSGGVHLDGARESQTLFILDGFDVGDPLNGGFDPRVSVESVQSMTVRKGVYAAEFGKGSGGVIEVATHVGGDRLRYSATDFMPTLVREKGVRVQDWTPRLSLSGPIARQRAWFSNGFIGEYDAYFVEELPKDQDSSTTRRFSDHLRSQLNLTSANVLHAGVLGSSGVGRRLGLTPLDPVSTTRDARSHQWFINVRDQHVFSTGAVLEAGYGANRTVLRLTPRGHDPYISTPAGRRGNYYYDGRQDALRDQVVVNAYTPPLSWVGTHQIKAGTDLNRVVYRQAATRGHIELYDEDDNLIRSIAYLGSGMVEESNTEAAAFVQDTWALGARFALQLGVRVDWDALTRDTTLSPRAMASWVPADGLKVSGGFAVTHDAARLQGFAAARDQTPVSIFAPPYGPGSLVLSRFVVGDQLKSPVAHTFTATIDRRLPGGLHLLVQGLRRRGRQGLAYFGEPSADLDVIYTLDSRRTERYDSGEVQVRHSFGTGYGWLVGYTRSATHSNAVLGNSPDSYFVAAENTGPLSWDVPHRLLSWGFFPTFRKPWSVSYWLEYRTGFPWSAADSAGFVVGPPNARRYPDYFDLTVGLERRTFLFGQVWALRGSAGNITSHRNPTSVNGTVESPDFGTFYGGHGPRLTFRVRWLGRQPRP